MSDVLSARTTAATAAANSGNVSRKLVSARASRPATVPVTGFASSRAPISQAMLRSPPALAPAASTIWIRPSTTASTSICSSPATSVISVSPESAARNAPPPPGAYALYGAWIVRRLTGDHHVVDVALAQARVGDADEP